MQKLPVISKTGRPRFCHLKTGVTITGDTFAQTTERFFIVGSVQVVTNAPVLSRSCKPKTEHLHKQRTRSHLPYCAYILDV